VSSIWKVLFIWPIFAALGKVLIPNLIRTAVPILANAAISRLVGPPQSPQSASYYDEEGYEEEDYEEYEDEEDYEDEP